MEYAAPELSTEETYLLRKKLMEAFALAKEGRRFTPEMLPEFLGPSLPFAIELEHILRAIEFCHIKGWVDYRRHPGLKRKEWFITPEGKARDVEE